MISEKNIDKQLIESFRNKCYESYMKKIISDLRKEEVLQKEYSQSGWMVFHGKTIHEIIEKTINSEVSDEMSKFLMVLLDRNRISYLDVIAERYLELVYELANIKIVEINSANELSDEQQQNLILKLKEMTKAKEIKLVLKINPNLLGGFLIKVNSQVIDLTIKGQLTELAKHLDSVLEL